MTATPAASTQLSVANLITGNDHASEAGFVWEYGEVSYRPNPKESTKVSLGQAPHVKCTDVGKFEANFPGVILAALDGTSILVACQAVTRRRLKAVRSGAPKPTDDELRGSVINALRGVKNRATVIERDNWLALDQSSFKTQAEAAEHSVQLLVAKGLDEDMAREIVESAMAE